MIESGPHKENKYRDGTPKNTINKTVAEAVKCTQ